MRIVDSAFPPLFAALMLTGLLAACEKQPAKIRVKLPRDALQSVSANPVLPPFEKKGDGIKLRASAYDADDVFIGAAKVKWSSTDPSVVVVDADGGVTTMASGEAKVVATTVGTPTPLTAEMPVKVVIIDKVEVSFDGKPEVHLGDTIQLQVKVLDDRGRPIEGAKVTWRTSDYAATVYPNGEVEGRAIGDTDVIAEAGIKRGKLNVKVLDWRPGKR